jgi:NAD(P)-dependent dehydrogenase (short-subunit alcohol dehydrogenase family)
VTPLVDLQGRHVLVTGGTRGIGLATALAFGRLGAKATITCKMGGPDEDEARRRFAAAGAPEPIVVQADAADDDDTATVLDAMQANGCTQVEAFVSNASAAVVVRSLDDLTRRAFEQSLDASAWPTLAIMKQIKARFGRWPRYVVAMSSTGPDSFSAGYELMAASKAALEALCRYLSYRLYDEDIRINVLRSRSVRTAAFAATFGEEFEAFASRFARESHWVSEEEVADAAIALCSGMMDGVRGQVVTVDRGTTFFDDLMRLYEEREELGL